MNNLIMSTHTEKRKCERDHCRVRNNDENCIQAGKENLTKKLYRTLITLNTVDKSYVILSSTFVH